MLCSEACGVGEAMMKVCVVDVDGERGEEEKEAGGGL